MRKSDQEKEAHSFIIGEQYLGGIRKVLVVKGESWNPGYTAAHKATPEEAIQHEIDKAQREQAQLDNRITKLRALKHDILKEN